MTILSVSNLSKSYSDTRVFENLDFAIRKGEFVSILGPNGCGKSTLLHILSGLDNCFSGAVNYHEEFVKKGFIFQNVNDSILPWKNLIDNIRLDNKKIHIKKIKMVLEDSKLWSFRKKYPYQLSGGMRQSLAIARAFIHGCNILFLDEPFSSLDYYMAISARENLLKLWQKNKPTVLFVSHDIDEIILISDKIILLSERPAKIKEILQIDLPRPRDPSVITSKEFNEYKKRIWVHIKNERK